MRYTLIFLTFLKFVTKLTFPDSDIIFNIYINKQYLIGSFVGEPGILIAGIPPTYVHGFYKGPKEINEKKIIRNAFKDGDSWFNYGDLMYMDKDYFVYFQDRVGDTFRLEFFL